MISTTEQPRQTPNLSARAFRQLLCSCGNDSSDSSRRGVHLCARDRAGCSSLLILSVQRIHLSERIPRATYSCGGLDRGRSEHDVSGRSGWRRDEAAARGADARGGDGRQVAGDGRITSGHFRDSGGCALRMFGRYD